MKPKFDLEDKRVKQSIEELKLVQEKALSAEPKIEKAVIPIAYKENPNNTHYYPEQIGSGVLVHINNHYFIFTATHVLLDLGQYGIITGVGNGQETEILTGDRYSTGKIETPKDDPYDASVYHITSNLSTEMKEKALELSDFEFQEAPLTNSIYLVSGFPSKLSVSEKGIIKSKKDLFTTFEYNLEIYNKLKYLPKSHIILAYEDLILNENQWKTSPRPKGMSGGAIIRVEGISISPKGKSNKEPIQKLSSIMTQHHREKNKNPGYILGTRLNVFLGLIDTNFPKLLDNFINSQNANKHQL